MFANHTLSFFQGFPASMHNSTENQNALNNLSWRAPGFFVIHKSAAVAQLSAIVRCSGFRVAGSTRAELAIADLAAYPMTATSVRECA